MRRDLTGLSPGWCRGCTMGNSKVFLGTVEPPEAAVYDCCEGYTTIPDGAEDDVMLRHSRTGLWSLGALKKRMGVPGAGLCDINPRMAQPNERCRDVFEMPEDLCCTYLERCDGGGCPGPPVPPFKNPECPPGTKPVDVGYESDPRDDELRVIKDLIREIIWDDWKKFFCKYGPLTPWISNPLWNLASHFPWYAAMCVFPDLPADPPWNRECTYYAEMIEDQVKQRAGEFDYWTVRAEPICGGCHTWLVIRPKPPGAAPSYVVDYLRAWYLLPPYMPMPPVPPEFEEWRCCPEDEDGYRSIWDITPLAP